MGVNANNYRAPAINIFLILFVVIEFSWMLQIPQLHRGSLDHFRIFTFLLPNQMWILNRKHCQDLGRIEFSSLFLNFDAFCT